MEKRSGEEEEGGVGKKDRIFRADKIDLKSLDKQLEEHLSRVWSRNLEITHKAKEEEWEINLAKLETENVIARGTFGTVYKGIYDGEAVAVKVLDWEDDGQESKTNRALFRQEVTVWHKLDHPNVTKFVGASMGTTNLKIPTADLENSLPQRACCVVVEYVSGGTLKHYLIRNRRKKLAFKVVIKLALDLSRGQATSRTCDGGGKEQIGKDRSNSKTTFVSRKTDLKMECVFGLVGNGFAIVAADTSAVHSILVHKNNEDKIMLLDSHKLIAASGEPGDRVQFTEYVQKNVSLYQFRNGIPLTTAAAANFTRGELATALRKNPYSVNILMAGYDKEAGASLYYIDYIATLHKVDKGAFGYGSYFSLSTMDRHFRSDMSVEEAIELVDKCIVEIRSRLVIAPPNFVIKIVDKDGARTHAWRQSVQDVTTASV
ncbi:unnamed protein product [Brassica oleracea]